MNVWNGKSCATLVVLLGLSAGFGACSDSGDTDDVGSAGEGGSAAGEGGEGGSAAGEGGEGGSAAGEGGEGGSAAGEGGEGGEAGAAGEAGQGGVAGAAGSAGAAGAGGQPEPLPESTCTGPGSENPDAIEGFPPAANATLDTDTWAGWGVSHGALEEVTDDAQDSPVIHHVAPGEGATSYFLAPAAMLGDLSDVAGVSFDLKSSGGNYYESGFAYLGDLVLQGTGGETAFAQIMHTHDGEWHSYFVPFAPDDATCWSVDLEGLTTLLSDVTGLAIRAEFGTGADETWLANVRLITQ